MLISYPVCSAFSTGVTMVTKGSVERLFMYCYNLLSQSVICLLFSILWKVSANKIRPTTPLVSAVSHEQLYHVTTTDCCPFSNCIMTTVM